MFKHIGQQKLPFTTTTENKENLTHCVSWHSWSVLWSKLVDGTTYAPSWSYCNSFQSLCIFWNSVSCVSLTAFSSFQACPFGHTLHFSLRILGQLQGFTFTGYAAGGLTCVSLLLPVKRVVKVPSPPSKGGCEASLGIQVGDTTRCHRWMVSNCWLLLHDLVLVQSFVVLLHNKNILEIQLIHSS